MSDAAYRIDSILSSLAIKAPVKALAETNITLSGEQTVGGVACVDGDRVLVAGQTDPVENGIYDVSVTTWVRSKDFDGSRDVADGTLITVRGPGAHPLYQLNCSDDPIIIGTSSLSFSQSGVTNGTDGADGSDGVDGLSTFIGNVYQRAASPPSTPAADDGSYNFTTRTLTPPTGWFVTPPSSDGNPLYVSVGIFQISGASGTDETVTWTAPQELVSDGFDGADGTDGIDGLSVFFAQAFQRAASPPSAPTGGDYNFTTKTLTPPSGWFTAPPAADGNPLYVTTAIAEIQGITGTDNTLSWSTPGELVSDGVDGGDGADGSDGLSTYFAQVFRRAASPPTTPTGGQYNFGTKTLTAPTDWSTTPPAVDGNPLYVSTTIAEIQGTTGIDSTLTWTTPAVLVSDGIDGADGADGADGTDGLSTAIASVYKRSATPPATPTTDDGSYNFSTKTLTPPAGWSVTPPTSDGNPVYVSVGVFQVSGGSGTDETVVWTTPQELLSDGVDGADGADGSAGADGLSIHFAQIFRRSASAPATPTGGQYNFGTKVLTPPTNWFDSPPASDGNPLYVSSTIAEIQGTTGIDGTLTWTTPAVLVSDGVDGSNGSNGTDGVSTFLASVYQRAASAPSTPTADDGSYNFSTRTLTPPTGWSASPPANDGNPLWISTGIFQISGGTGTDETVTWSTPQQLAVDGSDGAGVVTLPFFILSEAIGTLPQTAEIEFQTDGSLVVTGESGLVWYSAAPSTGIGSSYDVRCASVVAGSWDVQAAAVGTWIQISANRRWAMQRTVMEGAGSDQISATFQIRPTAQSSILAEADSSTEAADA